MTATVEVTEIKGPTGPSPAKVMLTRGLGHRGLMIGGVVLVAVLFAAVFAPWIVPHDPFDQDLLNRIVPPVWYDGGSWEHVLGTDHLGRDYLSRLIYGARISLIIGFATALISGIIGTVLGVTAGYFGGRVVMVITFVITKPLAFPAHLVALAVVPHVGCSLQSLLRVPVVLP